ncbi:MAG: VWA domain-containing protein [Chitinophagaceae bacterium]|nr:VWA domain-containing protein [Chitinophagaceae bacterium]
MFHFQHTEYLTALILVPLLVLLFLSLLSWKKARIAKIGDAKLVKELIKGYSPLKFTLRFVLFLMALALIITGAANLQSPGAMEKVTRKGVDVMIALDVSKSMLAEDIKPNRLDRAKQLVNKLMERMENDRVGLVVFAGKAYIQMPLTTDHSAARMYIQNAAPSAVPTQGTVISEALKISNSAFNSKDRKFKSILLISDGEDHDAEALKFTEALVKNGVMINAVGIGSPEGVPLIDKESNQLRKDAQGNAIITRLNEGELKQLSQQTKGVYVRLEDSDEAADKIMAQLSTIEQTSMGDQAFMNYKSYFQWFLAVALLLLLVEFFVSERKKIQLT